MTRFLLLQLRNRRWRAFTLAAGILAASVAFVLLAGSTRTSSIHVRGTLTRNFRGAYDILVRPRGSFTPLERQQGLVRDNYLSGIYGGISRRKYATIKRIPGVEVAAPIANIGTVLTAGLARISLRRFVTGARDQVLRVAFAWHADQGLSTYPGGDVYVYYTHRRFFLWPSDTDPYSKTVVADGNRPQPIPICEGFGSSQPKQIAPFAAANSQSFVCYSTNLSPGERVAAKKYGTNLGARDVRVTFAFFFPIALAAIDPSEEAKLLQLNKAMVSGSYLTEMSRPTQGKYGPVVPTIASARTYLDERLTASVRRLRIPASADLPASLAAGACSASDYPCDPSKVVPGPPGRPRQTAYRFVTGLPAGPVLARWSFAAGRAYGTAIKAGATLAYWTSTPVRYRRVGPDELAPIPVTNDDQTWINDWSGQSGYYDQPTDNRDVQFRKLTEARGSNLIGHFPPRMHTVGRFDPQKLPGFSPLAQIPLETYYPPALRAADARTRALLHGRPLLPSANIGGYAAQPPLLLTTLAGLAPFLDGSRWDNLSPRQQRAPISVIRVRVAGVNGPDALSQKRIKTVAQLIHDETGLAVDVTAGSSPIPITIDLAAGKFGRPPLELSEGWVKKGVAVAYLRALDRKDAALFGLVLIVCCFFLANGAFASVRTRRSEIGVLRTLGWGRRQIFVAALGELVAIAAAAGATGTVLALVFVRALGLDFPLTRVVFVFPTAIVLALIAGLGPAFEATLTQPLDAVRPRIAAGRRLSAQSIASLALLNARRLPLRSGLASLGIAIGVAALTLLIAIQDAFSGTLVGTLLGSAVSVQVRGPDLVAAGITITLAAFTVGDVLYLNTRERSSEQAVLKATGWASHHVLAAILTEASAIALLGSAIGATAGVALGATFLSIPVAPLTIAALIAAAAAVAASLLAAFVPGFLAARSMPLLALREE